MTTKKKFYIIGGIYAIFYLLPLFFAIPELYTKETDFMLNGKPIESGFTAAIAVFLMFFFMWGFSTYLTLAVFDKKAKKTK